jgi:bifunctional ADP-heptose synthase (sugar kinase/adenylyltransferase)
VLGLSDSGPVPVFLEDKISYRPTLAANIAKILVGFNSNINLLSVAGLDADQDILKSLLSGFKIPFHLFEESRSTLSVTRYLAGDHLLLEVQKEKCADVGLRTINAFQEYLEKEINVCSGLLVYDRGCGFITERIFTTVVFVSANSYMTPVYVSPDVSSPLSKYRYATLVSLSKREAEIACRVNLQSITLANLKKASDVVHDQTSCRYVCIDLGEKGIYYRDKELSIEGVATGNGLSGDVYQKDVIFSSLVYSLDKDADIIKACETACAATSFHQMCKGSL